MATLLLFMGAAFFSEACSEFEEIIGTEEIILWKLNCCDPSSNLGWSIAKTLFGWNNEATVSSTVGYFLYWFGVIIYVLTVYYCNFRRRMENSISQDHNNNNNNP
jgi:high-affinity iron transporter